MSYFVMEFVDWDFDIVDTRPQAEELAEYYEERMEECAEYNREWPKGSRVIIAEIKKDRNIQYIEEKDYYEMKTVINEFEEGDKDE